MSSKSFLKNKFISIFLTQLLLSPRLHAEPNRDKLQISLNSSINRSALLLTLPQAQELAYFELANPQRLVIDIPTVRINKNRTYLFNNDPFIARIRLGSHPEKCRLVVDLKEEKSSRFEIS